MRTCILAAGLLAAATNPAFAQIVLNEILFHPVAESPDPNGHPWVELFNKGTEPVDVGGWTIANREGRESPAAYRLPALSIPPAGYLVVHFSAGDNRPEFGPDGAHVYTGAPANPWNPDQDAVALYSSAGIVDFLAWRRRDDAAQPGPAHSDAVSSNIWSDGAALIRDFLSYEVDDLFRDLRPGSSIGRDQDSADTNRPQDFEPHGGRDSFFPTPGKRNLESIDTYLVTEDNAGVQERAAEPLREWTVLWYFSGTDYYPDLAPFLDLQANGGSTANVNYVIHWTRAASTVRGRISSAGPPGRVRLYSPDSAIQLTGINAASRIALKDFVDWGKANFPASRYALIVVGNGDGWKWLGSNDNILKPRDGRYDSDRLYPGELSGALAGADLELLALTTNYSAMVELAWQVRASAKFLLAFPNSAHLDFARLAQILSPNPTIDGQTLGTRLVTESRDPISLTNLGPLSDLISLLRQWSGQLRQAIPVFQERDQPLDNAQIGILDARQRSLHAFDTNFTDLADLAANVQQSRVVPACAKQAIEGILRWVNTNVVSAGSPFAGVPPRRLNIHFPLSRSHKIPTVGYSDAHDLPFGAREVDGNSRPVTYSLNYSMLPLDVEEEDGPFPPPLILPAEWPRKRAPEFPFPSDADWQLFLDEVYHPQPDNHIVEATFGGQRILPVAKGGAECRNPIDEITVPVGAVVALSGQGSSDFDPANRSILPYVHIWDLNHKRPCHNQPCLGPHEVAPGADALRAATDNVNADTDIANDTRDDLDERGPVQQFTCTEPGDWFTFLYAGDDDHTEPHADTLPTARHVHPQTRSWPSKIICTAPGTFVSTGTAIPFLETGTFVYSDHAVRAVAGTQTTSPRGFVPHQPFQLTLTGGADLRVNDVPVAAAGAAGLADETSGVVYADQEGILRTRFTAGPAGSGSLRIQPLGMPVFNLPFTVVNRLAPLPTDLQVTPPTGNLTVGADASLTIAVTQNGQPLGDAIVTAWSPTSTLTWVNGTRFRSDTASLFRAGPTGRFLATFRPTANGPVLIHIVAGQILRTLTLNATGGPASAPTAIEILPPATPLVQGAESSVTFRVLGAQLGLSGVAVRVEIQSGSVTLPGRAGSGPVDLMTGIGGDATLRLVPGGTEPVVLRATVPGTSLSAGATLVVLER